MSISSFYFTPDANDYDVPLVRALRKQIARENNVTDGIPETGLIEWGDRGYSRMDETTFSRKSRRYINRGVWRYMHLSVHLMDRNLPLCNAIHCQIVWTLQHFHLRRWTRSKKCKIST